MVPHRCAFQRVFFFSLLSDSRSLLVPPFHHHNLHTMLRFPTLRVMNHLSVRCSVGRNAVGASPRIRRVNARPQSRQFIRQMSSSPTKHLFLVYAPDYVSPGMLDHRLSVREKHLKGVPGLLESGIMSACDVQLFVVGACRVLFLTCK